MLAYNPRATDRVLVHETASGKMNLCATKMDGVHVFDTNNMKQAVYCAGGVKVGPHMTAVCAASIFV